jgi:3-deoxy-D-manno-octulosonic-acid transferase
MRRLYSALLWLAVPLASLVVLWRGLRNRGYWQGWRERFGFGYPVLASGLWVHAVSVGEVQVAATLLRALRRAYPARQLLLTCATPTGRERARQSCGDIAAIRYAPYDMRAVVRRVLRTARPELLIIIETELWPNLLHQCALSSVPVLLASARVTERTVRRIGHWPGLLSTPALANLQVAAQSQADAARFVQLGVRREAVTLGGNLKFDRAIDPQQHARGAALRARYAGARPMWVAGSTHPGEERAALEAHQALCRQAGSALLVLAPRHPQRFAAVAELLSARGERFERRSAAAPAGDGAHQDDVTVLLLDTLGELSDFYAAADLAFVGGSLAPVGGHNLLEPVALGVATLAGPWQFNGPDVARALTESGALCTVPDAGQLTREVLRLMSDASARARLATAGAAAVATNRGALERVLARVTALLPAQLPAPA